jgi:APA family basic amino acid/polyamine antiporter
MTPPPADKALERVIGFWGGLAVIVGITIGGGIFRKPHTLARDVGDPAVILGLWIAFGVVSLCGALALAELSSMLPHTGGVYVYLRSAYGDAAAFVFGWLFLLVSTPAAIGALATFFAELLLGLLGRDPGRTAPWTIPAVAAATIVALSGVNVLGARMGSAVQSAFTFLKIGALLALMAVSFTMPGGTFAHLAPASHAVRNIGSGAASVIWAYDGWVAVSMVAGEVLAPEKTMRRVIVGGMLLIVLLYAGANLGYFYALPVEAMAAETGGVPQRIVTDRLGPIGGGLIAAAILCSVFGALNGNILAKPRVAYAMARDRLTFGFLGRVHPRWSTPHAAILIQSGMAIVLRRAHDLLRGRRVVRAPLRGGRGHGAAAAAPRRAASFPHPRVSVGAAGLPRGNLRGAGGHRLGRDRPPRSQLRAAVGTAARRRGVPRLPRVARGYRIGARTPRPGLTSRRSTPRSTTGTPPTIT